MPSTTASTARSSTTRWPSRRPSTGRLVTTEALFVDVETRGEITTGMTVADRRGLTGKAPNLDVAVTADVAEFLDRLIERVGGLAADHSDVSR